MSTHYTEVPVTPPNPVDWQYFLDGLQAGSWAIVITFIGLGFIGRKLVSRYIDKAIETMDTIQAQARNNADIIKLIAQNDAQVAATLEKVQEEASLQVRMVDTYVKKFDQDNKVIIQMLRFLVKAEQDRQPKP